MGKATLTLWLALKVRILVRDGEFCYDLGVLRLWDVAAFFKYEYVNCRHSCVCYLEGSNSILSKGPVIRVTFFVQRVAQRCCVAS